MLSPALLRRHRFLQRLEKRNEFQHLGFSFREVVDLLPKSILAAIIWSFQAWSLGKNERELDKSLSRSRIAPFRAGVAEVDNRLCGTSW